jgi:hypothetical protein
MDIQDSIRSLQEDFNEHEHVFPKLTDEQIAEFARKAQFVVPPSFRIFLKTFGSGAYWLYGCQPLDSAENPFRLRTFQGNLPDMTELDGEQSVPTDSLLCLMTEDSNGGAWCWLTTLQENGGECPLAYWEPSSKKLYYKVESFANWLQLLVTEKNEVIRVLDVEERLGLG